MTTREEEIVIINEYKKLLQLGRDMFVMGTDSSLESHTHIFSEQLLHLNNYIFTNYSTNINSKTFSIEFAVLPDALDTILHSLKEKGLWYIAKNYKNNQYYEYVEESHNDKEIKTQTIHKTQWNRYKNNWIQKNTDLNNDTIQIESKKEMDIHLLSSESIQEFEYDSSENLFLTWEPLNDIVETQPEKYNINMNILSQNIAIVMVEDHEFYRETLYTQLYTIVKEAVEPLLLHYGGKRKQKHKKTKHIKSPNTKRNTKSRNKKNNNKKNNNKKTKKRKTKQRRI